MSDFEVKTWSDRFHNHLDRCTRCASRPFDLCGAGALLLMMAAKEAGDETWKSVGGFEGLERGTRGEG